MKHINCVSFVYVFVETSQAILRDVGGKITIQCRAPQKGMRSLSLQKGLNQDLNVLYRDLNSTKNTIVGQFSNRLQVTGDEDNVDILITNLTSEDTGPYWCVYNWFNLPNMEKVTGTGGSVLLVVRGEPYQFIHYLTKVFFLTIWFHWEKNLL